MRGCVAGRRHCCDAAICNLQRKDERTETQRADSDDAPSPPPGRARAIEKNDTATVLRGGGAQQSTAPGASAARGSPASAPRPDTHHGPRSQLTCPHRRLPRLQSPAPVTVSPWRTWSAVCSLMFASCIPRPRVAIGIPKARQKRGDGGIGLIRRLNATPYDTVV